MLRFGEPLASCSPAQPLSSKAANGGRGDLRGNTEKIHKPETQKNGVSVHWLNPEVRPTPHSDLRSFEGWVGLYEANGSPNRSIFDFGLGCSY